MPPVYGWALNLWSRELRKGVHDISMVLMPIGDQELMEPGQAAGLESESVSKMQSQLCAEVVTRLRRTPQPFDSAFCWVSGKSRRELMLVDVADHKRKDQVSVAVRDE